jgi:hypothetical protein
MRAAATHSLCKFRAKILLKLAKQFSEKKNATHPPPSRTLVTISKQQFQSSAIYCSLLHSRRCMF